MKVCDPIAGAFRGGHRGRNPVEPSNKAGSHGRMQTYLRDRQASCVCPGAICTTATSVSVSPRARCLKLSEAGSEGGELKPAAPHGHLAHVPEVVSDTLGDHRADPAVKGREPGLADGDHVGRSRGGERRARHQTSEGEGKRLFHHASPCDLQTGGMCPVSGARASWGITPGSGVRRNTTESFAIVCEHVEVETAEGADAWWRRITRSWCMRRRQQRDGAEKG